jgi:DNA modification methylase
LIDGYHRWKAHETEKVETIKCEIIQVKSEFEIEILAVKFNSTWGLQLSQDEKKKKATRWWGVLPEDEIIDALSISDATYKRWTKSKRDDQAKQIKLDIQDMWLACYTQQEIADKVGLTTQAVGQRITKFEKNDQMIDSFIFSNFDPKVYTVWNFPKLTNDVKIFGSIPQEIIDNLLYYYTKPFDVIFDPFGGGGSTIDKCIERKRRYYVSDLTPIPARTDIRQWDITQGLPDDLPVPDFVFLDPPYWKQAEKKYSEKDTDLGNVDIENFLKFIGDIAKNVKRKWGSNRPDARLAIIIGPFYRDGEYVDLPLLCAQAIGKYLSLTERIQVPYSTEIVGGDDVNKAKADKRMIHLIRDLMVFKKQ